jgi:hypothetical protein
MTPQPDVAAQDVHRRDVSPHGAGLVVSHEIKIFVQAEVVEQVAPVAAATA